MLAFLLHALIKVHIHCFCNVFNLIRLDFDSVSVATQWTPQSEKLSSLGMVRSLVCF